MQIDPLDAANAEPHFPTLETRRLRLREIVATDAPTLFQIHRDVDAMRWFGTDPMTTLHEAEQLVERFASWRNLPNPGIRWGIEERATGALIGSCGLFKWNRGWQACSLGYELAQPAWGQGFMQEALAATLAWGFDSMALNRIEAQVHPDNTASLKLLGKLGFVQEGLLRQAGYWLGAHRDLIQLSLLRQDHLAVAGGAANQGQEKGRTADTLSIYPNGVHP